MTAPDAKLAGDGSSAPSKRPHGTHHGGRRHPAQQAGPGHAWAASFNAHLRGANHRHAARAALVPEVSDALETAMSKEGVPQSWQGPLQFIIGQESNGQVGVSNHADSARGLFQLTRASYHLNPNGARSFGNPVEEAQGGIRYIERRYQTADNATQFWQKHGWY